MTMILGSRSRPRRPRAGVRAARWPARWAAAGCAAGLALGGRAWAQTAERPAPVYGGVGVQPQITSLQVSPQQTVVRWTGLAGVFQLEAKAGVGEVWQPVGRPTTNLTAIVPGSAGLNLFRVAARVPGYLGAATCLRCHPAIHADWSQTAHARAFENLKPKGQETNPQCLVCHTTGYGLPGGFKDLATTPGLAGVQCENCHGPGGEHAASPFEASLPVTRLDAQMCGGCHNQFHHPTFEEWSLSGHAAAGPAARKSALAADDCLQCHAGDYRLAEARGTKRPTVATAQYSLECMSCHAPHGATAQNALLRKPALALCQECHSQPELPLGQTPHHPQLEMLQGIGTLAENGQAMTNTSAHTTLLASDSCLTCHLVKHTVAQSNFAAPVMTTHNFNPFSTAVAVSPTDQYQACAPCHNLRTIDQYRKGIQVLIAERLAAVAAYFTPNSGRYIDPAALSAADQQRLRVARHNYQFIDADGSRGVHNVNNTELALEVAEAIVASLKNP